MDCLYQTKFNSKYICKEFFNVLNLKTTKTIDLYRVQLKEFSWISWTWFFHNESNLCVLFICFSKVNLDEFKKLILTGNSKFIDLDHDIKYIIKMDKYLFSSVLCIELSF